MGTELKAIETRYAGCRFRSRLEARWAVFFDALGVKWEYEKEGFDFGGSSYLPDFWLPESGVWWEVKGEHTATACSKTMQLVHASEKPAVVSFGQPYERTTWAFTRRHPKVYLAGKMTPWRERVAPLFDGAGVSVIGPDHLGDTHNIWCDDTEQIDDCDLVFAWIDAMDCYGTICEIGYASRARTDVWLEFSDSIDPGPFWLVEQAACSGYDERHSTPEDAIRDWLEKPPWDRWPVPTVTARENVFWGLGRKGERSVFLPVDRNDGAKFDWGYWYPGGGVRCDDDTVKAAEAAARSARFEFGENG